MEIEVQLCSLLISERNGREQSASFPSRFTPVKITNKMQKYRLISFSKSALHVPGDIFAQHQEQLTVFTKSVVSTPPPPPNERLNINNLQIEQVQQYKYLGSIINVSNSIEEEIKESIVLGTKAYYANLKFFKSRSVTKQLKLKL
jgi:hypothetical protein